MSAQHYGEPVRERQWAAKDARMAAIGRAPCNRCVGTGSVRPTGSSERVCPKCNGRKWHYKDLRMAPSGSWFEEAPRRMCNCGECGACIQREKARNRPARSQEERIRQFMENL